MITQEQFRSLLSRPESETLDFKSKSYDLGNEGGGLALVKDVICMANTPRNGASFIVTGIKKFSNGEYKLTGIASHPDEADLQSQFINKVAPVPIFSYYPFEFDGNSFGIIEMPPVPMGPCTPTKDFGEFLRKHQVYFRRGSRNDIAQTEDLKRIVTWINEGALTASRGNSDEEAWDDFKNAVHDFQPPYKYILITSSLDDMGEHLLPNLGILPWAWVFDFDPESESSGLLHFAKPILSSHRTIHLSTKGDRHSSNPERSTNWVFSNGLSGRRETMTNGSFRDWHTAYGRELKAQVDLLARTIAPAPVVCLAIWEAPDQLSYLRSLLGTLLESLGDSITFVIVASDSTALHGIASDFEANLLSIPVQQLLAGIRTIVDPRAIINDGAILIPSRSGTPIEVRRSDFAWFAEDLEVVHLGVGIDRPEGREIGKEFLMGNQIEWYELGLHSDIERDLTEKLERKVRRDLEVGRTVRINLFHSPGSGGTTIARRIIWNLHQRYPCVLVRRYLPEETSGRLYKLSSLTHQALLGVIDSSDISDRQIEQLFDELRSRQIPVILLQVLRRFHPQESRDRSLYLSANLSLVEARRFADILSHFAPNKREELLALAARTDSRECSPFYFGLHVFGKDFLALAPYVNARISGTQPAVQSILKFIAFTHHYAQNSLPAQAFASTLGIPQSSPVRLRRALPGLCLELLTETRVESWRTAHDLVAREILEQFLSTGISDRRAWKQNLSKLSIEFIGFCAKSSHAASTELLEILRRAFIYRDNIDVIGSERSASRHFSHLLEDIPSREGRLTILRELANSFPDEAHFWGHLGRFYSIEMRQFGDALKAMEKAIEIQPEDHLLHHMKGMILRRQMEEAIGDKQGVEVVESLARAASDCFQKARDLDPDDEHGYISEVQMLCRVMDYGSRRFQGNVLKFIAAEKTDSFIRHAFEKAEDLLEQVRRSREGEGPSTFEIDCRANLNSLYGEHDQALQAWTNMLTVRGAYRPPLRRQIVRTYLARRDRSWLNLKPKEVQRSVELLEENLQEDPHNDADLRLWLQAIRHLPNPPNIYSVIEKVSYWKLNSGNLEATFYLYVLHALLALEGSPLNLDEAEFYIAECRQLARRRKNRRKSFEWFGPKQGLAALVHQSELGEWNDNSDFWSTTERLKRLGGRIKKIDAPQSGVIEISGGIDAFFVPAKGDFFKGRSENQAVSFYLGFSYEGPRAWGVQELDRASEEAGADRATKSSEAQNRANAQDNL